MTRVYRRRKLMRTLAALTLTATSAAALMAAQHSPAAAAPGDPELAPIIWSEGFETGLGNGELQLLTDYSGAGGTYTGDDYWVTGRNCNGLILDGGADGADLASEDCTAGDGPAAEAGGWATAIGQRKHDASPQNNHALINWTNPNSQVVADRGIVVKSEPISVTPGHYLAIGLNHAGGSCDQAHPELSLIALVGTTEHLIKAFDPCTNALSSGGHWRVPQGVTEFQYVVRNDSVQTFGNDFALDDLTVRDLTPQLSQTFDPTEATAGDPVAMTYTVTNTGDPDAGEPIVAKNNFSFTDRLPDGLRIVELGDTDCGDGVLSKAPDEERVVLEGGDLANGQEFCTITLTVTSDEAATYRNPHILSEVDGVVPHDPTTVTFTAAEEPVEEPAEEEEEPHFVAPDTGAAE